MADVVSSDGHCSVRLHTAWASVLVWTDLTGTITVRRNGIDIATLAPGRMIYYDHYFTPLGSTDAYSVTNGTTTSTTASITVPVHSRHWTWVKSAVNPNLSVPLGSMPFADISWMKRGGAFDIAGSSETFVIEAGLGKRTWPFTWWTDVAASRAKLLALFDAGPCYFQFDPMFNETDMWATVKPGASVSVSRIGKVAPSVVWTVSAPLVEITQPATSKLGNIIPGWGWDNVKATYATWNAEKAAQSTWLNLVKFGVT